MVTTEMCESSYNLFNYYDTPQTSGHVEAMENSWTRYFTYMLKMQECSS